MTTITVVSSWTPAQWSLLEFIAAGGRVTVTTQGRRRVAHSTHPSATVTNLDQLADWNLLTITQGAAQVTGDGRRALLEADKGVS